MHLLIVFLLVLIAPLLIATWRTSLLGLALQGLLMGWMVLARHQPPTLALALVLLDLFVVRGVLVPRALYRILKRQQAPRRNDVIPANLLSWSMSGALVLLSFRFAKALCPTDRATGIHVAVASAGVLLGLLILATQNGTFSQIVGVLRIENALALFELAGKHQPPLLVQLGSLTVYVLTVAVFGVFLQRLGDPGADATPEGGTL
jgi:hydrogenase-4 component E